MNRICTFTAYEEHNANLFYISDKEDYKSFKKDCSINEHDEEYFHSDFNKYGAGWYLYWYEDGYGFRIHRHLMNYDAYEREIESNWTKYKSYMRSQIEKKATEDVIFERKDYE